MPIIKKEPPRHFSSFIEKKQSILSESFRNVKIENIANNLHVYDYNREGNINHENALNMFMTAGCVLLKQDNMSIFLSS